MIERLDIKVSIKRVPLLPAGERALKKLDTYDLIVFSSKHAQKFFMQVLRERAMKVPRRASVLKVGPRADLLKHKVAGKRVLYPRSAKAPSGIIKSLRARGARVAPLVLYTALPKPLLPAQRRALLEGVVKSLYFRSPSGVHGLLVKLSRAQRRGVLAIPARCIGATTAAAARAAGFSRVSIKRL